MSLKEKYIKTAIDALESTRGDDYFRAKLYFKNYTAEQMNKEYGLSGKTCKKILQEYAEHDKRIDDAIEWLEALK